MAHPRPGSCVWWVSATARLSRRSAGRMPRTVRPGSVLQAGWLRVSRITWWMDYNHDIWWYGFNDWWMMMDDILIYDDIWWYGFKWLIRSSAMISSSTTIKISHNDIDGWSHPRFFKNWHCWRINHFGLLVTMWFWKVVALTAGATGDILIAFLSLVSERRRFYYRGGSKRRLESSCNWVNLKILIREAQLQSPSLYEKT